jgi:xylulokinase
MSEASDLFLGFDSSTQSLKVIAINRDLDEVYQASVNFDQDCPEFNTRGGVHHHEDGLTVTSPPQLWVRALDILLEKMKTDGFEFSRVRGISGSGQQHGSVYFKTGSRTVLQSLDSSRSLAEQLNDTFSVSASPIWMDSSTRAQCRHLEEVLGGAQATADLTGSRAYERFTGNQIARVAAEQFEAYAATERIALVSSFICSLFIGDYAPIDTSDGSGMNLMNIQTKDWAQSALDACAPGLRDRLGALAPGHEVAGPIHAYYVNRYGVSPDCKVMVFSGDNPCSLAGLRLQNPGDIAVSMGTSDTIFGVLKEPQPSGAEGHIFANPVDPASYMAMLCYKNGSLTREEVRDRCTEGSWEDFNALLGINPAGNNGQIGFYFKEPEITPPMLKAGNHRFDEQGNPVDSFDPASEVRAIVEGQFLSMRHHCVSIGIKPVHILATGGGSQNSSILQVMADVFCCPVFVADSPHSAALGAAYRALHGHISALQGTYVPYSSILEKASPFQKAAEPHEEAHVVYTAMMRRYAALEEQILGNETA